MKINIKFQIKIKNIYIYRRRTAKLYYKGPIDERSEDTLRQQCELIAKVAATSLAYIALIKVKQSHRKKDQVFTTHCIMQKSREQSIALETIFTERKEQF